MRNLNDCFLFVIYLDFKFKYEICVLQNAGIEKRENKFNINYNLFNYFVVLKNLTIKCFRYEANEFAKIKVF